MALFEPEALRYLLLGIERAQIMSSIIAFRPRRTPASKQKPNGAGDASVIIFPGVRYERPAQSDAAAKWIQPAFLAPYKPRPQT